MCNAHSDFPQSEYDIFFSLILWESLHGFTEMKSIRNQAWYGISTDRWTQGTWNITH